MRTDGRYDPGEDPPFDHDPFGPSAPPRGAAAPGLGLGPPWALPLVAGVLALVFIAAMLWLYTGRGAGGGALAPESAEVLPLIPAPSEPARLEPEPAAQPPADSAVFETFAPGPGAPAPPASVEPPQDAPETPAAEQAAEAQSVPADQNAQTQDAAMGAAIAPPPAKPARASAQAAGEQVSPETLAFVQSVLGQEGGGTAPLRRARAADTTSSWPAWTARPARRRSGRAWWTPSRRSWPARRTAWSGPTWARAGCSTGSRPGRLTRRGRGRCARPSRPKGRAGAWSCGRSRRARRGERAAARAGENPKTPVDVSARRPARPGAAL